jgi:hypothetical protein
VLGLYLLPDQQIAGRWFADLNQRAIQSCVTFAEMRAAGVRGLLIYCADYRCSHSTTMSADSWPDDVRLSDISRYSSAKGCGVISRASISLIMCTVGAWRSNASAGNHARS